MPFEQQPNQDHASLERVNAVYAAALEEHPEFTDFPEHDIKTLIKTSHDEIEVLERVANPKEAIAALTSKIAEKISALWVFSGPGTYEEPVKNDSYKDYPWARGMDRVRINYAVFLARKIAEIRSGARERRGPIHAVTERKQQAKAAISSHGPAIIYNGNEIENAAAERALAHSGSIVPSEKAEILELDPSHTIPEPRTFHQIKLFKLPEHLYQPGNEIAIVSHAPQLPRILRMLNRYQTLPKDMTVRLFPLPTPPEGKEEYATLEIKGLLYYVFLSPDHDATREPYPHVIHGKESAD